METLVTYLLNWSACGGFSLPMRDGNKDIKGVIWDVWVEVLAYL